MNGLRHVSADGTVNCTWCGHPHVVRDGNHAWWCPTINAAYAKVLCAPSKGRAPTYGYAAGVPSPE